VAWPLAAREQRPSIPVIGFVDATTAADTVYRVSAFRDGLKEAGFIDGHTPRFRGAFDAHKTYASLDVIESDGASYIACHDNPGIPAIDAGWQLLCSRGSRGPVGETGPRGRKGERGARGAGAPTIVNWTIDTTHYRAIPTMSDGKAGTAIELRPLFERFCEEAIGPAVDAALTAAMKNSPNGNATRTRSPLSQPISKPSEHQRRLRSSTAMRPRHGAARPRQRGDRAAGREPS
jgi:hypothetical protein